MPGIVCLCEDVGVDDLDHAWHEGFRSTEILKRYTTATMGPCQVPALPSPRAGLHRRLASGRDGPGARPR